MVVTSSTIVSQHHATCASRNIKARNTSFGVPNFASRPLPTRGLHEALSSAHFRMQVTGPQAPLGSRACAHPRKRPRRDSRACASFFDRVKDVWQRSRFENWAPKSSRAWRLRQTPLDMKEGAGAHPIIATAHHCMDSVRDTQLQMMHTPAQQLLSF